MTASAAINHEPYLLLLSERLTSTSADLKQTLEANSEKALAIVDVLDAAIRVFTSYTVQLLKNQTEHALADAVAARQKLEHSEMLRDRMNREYLEALQEHRAESARREAELRASLSDALTSLRQLDETTKADAATARGALQRSEAFRESEVQRLDQERAVEMADAIAVAAKMKAELTSDANAREQVFLRELRDMEAQATGLFNANMMLDNERATGKLDLRQLRDEKDSAIKGVVHENESLRVLMQQAMIPAAPPSAWRKVGLAAARRSPTLPVLRANASLQTLPSADGSTRNTTADSLSPLPAPIEPERLSASWRTTLKELTPEAPLAGRSLTSGKSPRTVRNGATAVSFDV